MTWMQTYTGYQAFPLNLRPECVDLDDIAHALGNLCRFNGHCLSFYSVAEHSVRVAEVVWQLSSDGLGVGNPHETLHALLHDAAEAYLGDIPKPLKGQCFFNVPVVAGGHEGIARRSASDVEQRMREAISEALEGYGHITTANIKQADLILLATEKRDLMSEEPAAWMPLPEPLRDQITETWTPQAAATQFKLHYYRLLSMCQQRDADDPAKELVSIS